MTGNRVAVAAAPRAAGLAAPLLAGLLSCVLLGCAGGEPSGTLPVEAPPAGGPADGPATRLAQKKQMLMDQGFSAEEIAERLNDELAEAPASAFLESAESNREPPARIADLVFVRPSEDHPSGEKVRLADALGNQRLVLVMMRGFSGGAICPFCVAQTAELAANYDEFKQLDAEVMIVYPGDPEHVDAFVTAAVGAENAAIADVRWDVLMDPDLSAVELLDIAADLASPSTFIFDRRGNVVFAYVGAKNSDRPSARALLEQLRQLDAS